MLNFGMAALLSSLIQGNQVGSVTDAGTETCLVDYQTTELSSEP